MLANRYTAAADTAWRVAIPEPPACARCGARPPLDPRERALEHRRSLSTGPTPPRLDGRRPR